MFAGAVPPRASLTCDLVLDLLPRAAEQRAPRRAAARLDVALSRRQRLRCQEGVV